MFESVVKFLKNIGKNEKEIKSKDSAKERLHLVLMQDRANISADFLALMKQEIIEVIKKYIEIDENAIDVRLTNKSNNDGTNGAPVLYANIPIKSVKEEAKEEVRKEKNEEMKKNKEENTVKTEEVEEINIAFEKEDVMEKVDEIIEEVKEEKIINTVKRKSNRGKKKKES